MASEAIITEQRMNSSAANVEALDEDDETQNRQDLQSDSKFVRQVTGKGDKYAWIIVQFWSCLYRNYFCDRKLRTVQGDFKSHLALKYILNVDRVSKYKVSLQEPVRKPRYLLLFFIRKSK